MAMTLRPWCGRGRWYGYIGDAFLAQGEHRFGVGAAGNKNGGGLVDADVGRLGESMTAIRS